MSRGRRLDLAFGEAAGALERRERAWVQEATYGAVRLRGRLDFLLDTHLRQGLSSLSPLLLDLFRLGAYQLLYMDGVPAYAALSQTVDQVRGVAGKGGGRLANGVLRSLEREGGGAERFPAFHREPERHLSTWGSHPTWLVRRWLGRWEPDEVLVLVEGNNEPPPLFLRPLSQSPSEAVRRLGETGRSAEAVGSGVPCVRVKDGTDPATLLEIVPGIVQDPGAALVIEYADPPPGVLVADLCAAPGGKSLSLAAAGFRVLAGDRSLPRLRVLRENLARIETGLDVSLVAGLAQTPPLARAPFLLLDVPCSGTGTFRRHPDARWRLTPDTLEDLVELQREILDAGRDLVPEGGHLVYSTCTLESEENEAQVDSFLARNPGFRVEESGVVDPGYLDGKGRLMVFPQKTDFDGAFGARLVRTS